jgi:hypothetical protein
MEIIFQRWQLRKLAQRLGVRPDWHEPDEQCLTARVEGKSFDNAGFWPTQQYATGQLNPDIVEHHVIFSTYKIDDETGEPVDIIDIAAVNLATLCAWAAD